MQVEYVAGVRLTSGRSLEQERNCTVCNRVLAEVVVYDKAVLALIHKVFSDSRSRVRRNVLQRRRVGGSSAYYYSIVKRAVLFEVADELGNSRCFLTDSVINTDTVLALLVKDSIKRNRRLTRLTVADNKLTLTAAYREHRVDSKNARLKRLRYRLSVDNRRSRLLNKAVVVRLNIALAVNRLAERVYNSADERFTDGNARLLVRTLNARALADFVITAEENTADSVLLDILHHSLYAGFKDNNLAVHNGVKSVNGSNTVADADNGADFLGVRFELEILNIFLKDRDNAACVDVVILNRVLLYALLNASELRPEAAVILLACNVDNEAAEQRRVLDNLNLRVRSARLLADKRL